MTEEKKVVRKNIMSTREMGRIMAEYFHEMDQASKTGDKKVAWCTSVGPAELLLAMGFLVYYPENHGAMLGSTRMATDLIPHANALGYSPDICSYLTSDIGSFLKGETPLTKAFGIESVPKPDVLVFNTNQCRDVKDWFAWYSRKFNVPLLGVHTPREIGEITDDHLQSIAKEIEALDRSALVVPTDLTDLSQLQKMVDQVQAKFGRIDILINNAAWTPTVEALEVTEEQWDQTIATSLKAVFFLSQAVARIMIPQGGGKIINMGSTLGEVSLPAVRSMPRPKPGFTI